MTTKNEINAVPGGASSSRSGLQIIGRAILGVALVFSGAPVATTAAQQDLADAARQERARKQTEPSPVTHVYTNDDLARHEILTPADRSRFVSARAPANPAPETEAATSSAPDEQVPLGDVARFYRAQREAEARTEAATAPAAPRGSAFPLIASSTPLASMKPAPARASAPATSVWPSRSRDPFARVQSQLAPSVTPNTAPAKISPVAPRRIDPVAVPVVARTQPTRAVVSAAVTKTLAPAVRVSAILVVEGDTLWSLSRKHLGSGTRWMQIVAVNPGLEDPRQLRAGMQLVLPAPQY